MAAPASRPLWQMPRIDPSDRWVGGVASAMAREIGVQPLVIRTSFVALALVAGWGLLLYALCWAALGFFGVSSQSPYSPCLLYTSPSPRDLSTSRMPSSA